MRLTDKEFDILDEVYFVTSWQDIQASMGCDADWLNDGLASLLRKNYVAQFAYSTEHHDFLRQTKPDLEKLEPYHYLATKEGLLAHNL